MPLRLRKLLLGSSALALSISFAPLQDCQALDTSALQPENALSVDDFYPIEKTASVPSQTSEAQDPVLEQLASEYGEIADNFVLVQQAEEDRRFFSEFKSKTIAGFTHDQITAATKAVNASYEFAVDDDDFPAAEELLRQGSRVQYFGINDGDGGVFVTHKDGTAHLAFRGSANLNNWYENTKFAMVDTAEGGRYHTGFYNGYCATKHQVWAMIEQFAETQGKTVTDLLENDLVVTGHSRGGAIASIFSDIARRRYQAVPHTVTFEAPRALHKKTAARYESLAHDRHLSIAQFTDPVYYVNMAILSGAKHVGTLACIPTDSKVVSALARWHTIGSVNAVLDEMTTLGCYADGNGDTYLLDEYHAKQRNLFAESDHSVQAYAASALQFGGGLLSAATTLAGKVGSAFTKQDAQQVVQDAFNAYEVKPRMAQSTGGAQKQNAAKVKPLAQTTMTPREQAQLTQDSAQAATDMLKEFEDFLAREDVRKRDAEIKASQAKAERAQHAATADQAELGIDDAAQDDAGATAQAAKSVPAKTKKRRWYKPWTW